MEKIFDQGVVNMLPLPKGILVTFSSKGNGVADVYKIVSFDDGRVSIVPEEIFMAEKFGSEYKKVLQYVDNSALCYASHLSNGELIVLLQNGNALLFTPDGELKWQGDLRFKGEAATGLTAVGRKLWVAYGKQNAVIRYNAITMKSELRIGGNDTTFKAPQGVWLANNKLTVCSAQDKKLYRIDLDSFELIEHATLKEPIYQYFNISGYELIRLESGIYLL